MIYRRRAESPSDRATMMECESVATCQISTSSRFGMRSRCFRWLRTSFPAPACAKGLYFTLVGTLRRDHPNKHASSSSANTWTWPLKHTPPPASSAVWTSSSYFCCTFVSTVGRSLCMRDLPSQMTNRTVWTMKHSTATTSSKVNANRKQRICTNCNYLISNRIIRERMEQGKSQTRRRAAWVREVAKTSHIKPLSSDHWS